MPTKTTAPAKPRPRKIDVGDRVRLTGASYPGRGAGRRGTVTQVGGHLAWVHFDGASEPELFAPRSLVRDDTTD